LEAANDDDSYTAVSDICGAFYGEGAKCNKYMGNDGNYAVSNSSFVNLKSIFFAFFTDIFFQSILLVSLQIRSYKKTLFAIL
jgi:hypothetical protein